MSLLSPSRSLLKPVDRGPQSTPPTGPKFWNEKPAIPTTLGADEVAAVLVNSHLFLEHQDL